MSLLFVLLLHQIIKRMKNTIIYFTLYGIVHNKQKTREKKTKVSKQPNGFLFEFLFDAGAICLII